MPLPPIVELSKTPAVGKRAVIEGEVRSLSASVQRLIHKRPDGPVRLVGTIKAMTKDGTATIRVPEGEIQVKLPRQPPARFSITTQVASDKPGSPPRPVVIEIGEQTSRPSASVEVSIRAGAKPASTSRPAASASSTTPSTRTVPSPPPSSPPPPSGTPGQAVTASKAPVQTTTPPPSGTTTGGQAGGAPTGPPSAGTAIPGAPPASVPGSSGALVQAPTQGAPQGALQGTAPLGVGTGAGGQAAGTPLGSQASTAQGTVSPSGSRVPAPSAPLASTGGVSLPPAHATRPSPQAITQGPTSITQGTSSAAGGAAPASGAGVQASAPQGIAQTPSGVPAPPRAPMGGTNPPPAGALGPAPQVTTTSGAAGSSSGVQASTPQAIAPQGNTSQGNTPQAGGQTPGGGASPQSTGGAIPPSLRAGSGATSPPVNPAPGPAVGGSALLGTAAPPRAAGSASPAAQVPVQATPTQANALQTASSPHVTQAPATSQSGLSQGGASQSNTSQSSASQTPAAGQAIPAPGPRGQGPAPHAPLVAGLAGQDAADAAAKPRARGDVSPPTTGARGGASGSSTGAPTQPALPLPSGQSSAPFQAASLPPSMAVPGLLPGLLPGFLPAIASAPGAMEFLLGYLFPQLKSQQKNDFQTIVKKSLLSARGSAPQTSQAIIALVSLFAAARRARGAGEMPQQLGLPTAGGAPAAALGGGGGLPPVTQEGPWYIWVVPFHDNRPPLKIGYEAPQEGSDTAKSDKRFFIETQTSSYGLLTLTGRIQNKRLEVRVTSDNAMEKRVLQGIQSRFYQACEAVGLIGRLRIDEPKPR